MPFAEPPERPRWREHAPEWPASRLRPRNPIPGLVIASRAVLAGSLALLTPRCPRCGARYSESVPSPDLRSPALTVSCLACRHEWTIVPQDALLGP